MKIFLSILLSLFCFSTVGWIVADIYFSIFPLDESIIDNVWDIPANKPTEYYFNVLITTSNIVAIIYNVIFFYLCSKSKISIGKVPEIVGMLPWIALFTILGLPFSIGKALLFALVGVASMATVSSLYFIKLKSTHKND